METYYAPAPKTERRLLKNQIGTISQSPVMNTLLKAVSGLLIVLNEDRQIVALNYAFLDAIGVQNPEEALGLRLGESLRCIHSSEPPNGCGTTPHCITCGAAIAMMAAINQQCDNEQVCALTVTRNGVTEDISLHVRAQPLTLGDNTWILFYAQDITQQQFWMTLERVFFHDISNMLNTIIGNIDLLAIAYPKQDEIQRIQKASMRLVSELSLQKSLALHKDAHYKARKVDTTVKQIQEELTTILSGHGSAKDKEFLVEWQGEDKILQTDCMLVSRILGNMVINAFEATESRGVVKLTINIEATQVSWSVWNNSYIQSDIQRRVFQRHFSTKSQLGRGLGTYSMKLFGEEYLGGQVSFISTKHEGTSFTFCLPLIS